MIFLMWCYLVTVTLIRGVTSIWYGSWCLWYVKILNTASLTIHNSLAGQFTIIQNCWVAVACMFTYSWNCLVTFKKPSQYLLHRQPDVFCNSSIFLKEIRLLLNSLFSAQESNFLMTGWKEKTRRKGLIICIWIHAGCLICILKDPRESPRHTVVLKRL